MPLILSLENVTPYLVQQGIILKDASAPQIERRDYKNFNLLLKFDETAQFLVKQERFDWQGQTSGDLAFEWRIQELLLAFPALAELRSLFSDLLLYDPDQSILVSQYFPGFEDLDHFYDRTEQYEPELAAEVGRAIARTHRLTWHPDYGEFLGQFADGELIEGTPRLLRQIESVGPGLFAHFSLENLEFFRIYQTAPKLRRAVKQLRHSWRQCCLIHRDLRLSNLVVDQAWAEACSGTGQSREGGAEQSISQAPIRIIDWEKFAWGDPAYDLGTLIANYLRLWLGSLAMHQDLPLQQALRWAEIPLEVLQPSLAALVTGYLAEFPDVRSQYPDFVTRSLQFAGLVLLEKVLLKLEHRHRFGNTDICAMQVAQAALERPQVAAQQFFDWSLADLGVSQCAAKAAALV